MILRISVRCLIVKEGSILVQLSKHGDFYRLPGGRLRPEETILHALKREISEELGIEIDEPKKLVYVVDSFYKRRANVVHEVSLYFLCDIGDNVKLKPREEHVKVKWVKLEDINEDNFRPKSLAEILKHDALKGFEEDTKYVVNIEVD
ncbi:MAG: NUDIX domain-containing protein [Pyrodictiaceae archaeon]